MWSVSRRKSVDVLGGHPQVLPVFMSAADKKRRGRQRAPPSSRRPRRDARRCYGPVRTAGAVHPPTRRPFPPPFFPFIPLPPLLNPTCVTAPLSPLSSCFGPAAPHGRDGRGVAAVTPHTLLCPTRSGKTVALVVVGYPGWAAAALPFATRPLSFCDNRPSATPPPTHPLPSPTPPSSAARLVRNPHPPPPPLPSPPCCLLRPHGDSCSGGGDSGVGSDSGGDSGTGGGDRALWRRALWGGGWVGGWVVIAWRAPAGGAPAACFVAAAFWWRGGGGVAADLPSPAPPPRCIHSMGVPPAGVGRPRVCRGPPLPRYGGGWAGA